jgi:hypothetical protein
MVRTDEMVHCRCEGLSNVDAEREQHVEIDRGEEQVQVEAGWHWGGSKQKEGVRRNGEREMTQQRDGMGQDVRGSVNMGRDTKAGNTDTAVGEGAVQQGSGADKAMALVGVVDKKADGEQPLDPLIDVLRTYIRNTQITPLDYSVKTRLRKK